MEKVVDKINRWIKERRERINRKRLFYIVLPGILFLSLFTYLFLRNNTFYAGFTSKDYDNQQEEIVISRGIDSSRERISTGILIREVKDLSSVNDLRSKLRIGFWSKNNWDNLEEILPVVESGEFLYKIGRMKLGIEKLIDALKDESSSAVESLVRLGKTDQSVIEALIPALKDEDSSVRRMAAGLLVRLGGADKTVIEAAFLLALKDESSNVRHQAAKSLGHMGKADKIVIEVLISVLKNGSSDLYRKASELLLRLGKANKTVIEVIILALKDEGVRFQAAELLARLGKADKTVIDALILALKDEDSSVRLTAADSMVRLGKVNETVIEAFIRMLKDESSDIRQDAGTFLGILWEKKSETELIELLKHPLSGYRTASAYALRYKKAISPETLDEIIRLKDTDNRPWVRLGAWKAFELLQEKKEKEQNKDLD